MHLGFRQICTFEHTDGFCVLLVFLVVALDLHFHCFTCGRNCITGNTPFFLFFVHHFREILLEKSETYKRLITAFI